MQVHNELVQLFSRARTRAIESGDITPDLPTKQGLLAVLESMRAYMENIELTPEEKAFLRRIAGHSSIAAWPEDVFAACTAIVISRLSGEREDADA